MKLTISTIFNCPYDTAVGQLYRSALLTYICWPIQEFKSLSPAKFPSKWQEGEYLTKVMFLGVIPIGRQTINISFSSSTSPNIFILRDNGRGTIAHSWDHTISIEELTDSTVRYSDTTLIQAGILTLPVFIYAHILYRWRQHRWKKLIAHNFNQLGKT